MRMFDFYDKNHISYEELFEYGKNLSDHFRKKFCSYKNFYEDVDEQIISVLDKYYLEKYDYSLSLWIKQIGKLYDKPDAYNLYSYWIFIYNKIKGIYSIHEQSKEYRKLTSQLNPGQMLQCDFYRILQTLKDQKFEVVYFNTDISKYFCRESKCLRYVFKFIVRKGPWIMKIFYSDNQNCVGGVLKPYYILNMHDGNEYESDNLFSYHTYDEITPNFCTECIE